MELNALKALLEEKGVVGAGGAGFPSYLKLNENAQIVIVNGAECEPLSNGDKLLLANHTLEILNGLTTIVGAVGAQKGVVAVKKSANDAALAVKAQLDNGGFENIELICVDDVYPAGDEVVLTFEATGQTVPQGGLPIDVGVIVFNVETVFNICKAVAEGAAVTHKIVSVAGAVNTPITLRVPLGVTVAQVIEAAGGIKTVGCEIIIGGAMTGRLADLNAKITKTTNSILVLPENNPAVVMRKTNIRTDMRRAFSVCSQCRMCTDLCPRALLGHSVAPHALMRMVTSGNTTNVAPYVNSFYCCSCGVCEMFACHQGLSPRKIVMTCKMKLKENGVKPDDIQKTYEEHPLRIYRQVPSKRLEQRLGLSTYYNGETITDFFDKF